MPSPVVTLFAIPKAFEGHTAVIQRNAIRSWAKLGVPIILMADDAGTREMAEEVGATYIPNVARNELGTPLLDSAFALAQQHATTPVIAYVNSDIIFTSALTKVLQNLRLDSFLAVGRRTNIDCEIELDTRAPNYEADLLERCRGGKLDVKEAIDYFIMPRNSPLTKLLPFAVGRAGWDNWMIARAVELDLPIIDLTRSVPAIHQNHGYGHVKKSYGHKWQGPEGDANIALMKGKYSHLGMTTHFADENGELRIDAAHLTEREFARGYELRTKERQTALRHYLRSFRHGPSLRQPFAIAKLLLPTSWVKAREAERKR